MGVDRNRQDSHARPEQQPKLSWAGRLDGVVDGRPVSLVAEDRELTLLAGSFTTLFALRRSWRATVQPLRALFERAELRLMVQTKWLGKMEVFPHPSRMIRFLLPRG